MGRPSCGTRGAQRATCAASTTRGPTTSPHGQLIQVPDERDFVGLCRDERGLVQISCEVWQGWIFVNQDPQAAPLHDWFGPALDQLDELAGDSLTTITTRSVIVPCNWKVTAEAFLEVYHFRHIHARGPAGGDTALDNRGATMGLLPNGCSRMITPLLGVGRQGPRDVRLVRLAALHRRPPFTDIDSVSDVVRSTSAAYSLFPNLISPLGSYGFPFLLFWPLDKRTTKLDWIHYGPKDWDGDELPVHWQKRMDGFDEIMEEDMRNMAPMQRSLESPAMRGVPINYQERRIWHLHEQIDRTIGADRIPEELRVPELLARYVERDPVRS